MVGLAFAIAASANFPILFLSIYWSKLTTRGAVIGGSLGLATAVILVILGPVVWVGVLHNAEPIFPYAYPALFSVTTAFVGIWFFSITDNSQRAKDEIEAFRIKFLSKKGFTDITLMVGDDRIDDFMNLIKTYNNHQDPEKALNFNSFQVVSVGSRIGEDRYSGVSASGAREFATKNNFKEFISVFANKDRTIARKVFSIIQQRIKSK